MKKRIIESLAIYSLGCVFGAILCVCWEESGHLLVYTTYSGFYWLLLVQGSLYLVKLLDRWVDWLNYPLARTLATFPGGNVTGLGCCFHFVLAL